MRHFYSVILAILAPFFLHAQITFQVSITNVACFGASTGAAEVNATGGIPPYTYKWNTGATTQSISGLPAGVYSVTATDNSGLSGSKSVTVTQPPAMNVTLNGQPQICNVAPDGFSYAIPMGGTPPYSFQWSNNVNTQINNHLAEGVYSVTVTDIKGCTATNSYTVNNLNVGLYLFTATEKASCPAPNDGSAKVTVASGTAPYEYTWSNGGNTATLAQLYAGIYTVTVTDANGCIATSTLTVDLEPSDPILVQIPDNQCLSQEYDFLAQGAYTNYSWLLNDPRDTIIDGQGKRQIKVKWGADGYKDVSVNMVDSVTQCATLLSYRLVVESCSVDTKAPAPLDEVRISPNPFVDYIDLTISELQSGEATVQVFSIQGTSVLFMPLIPGQNRLNTESLLPGVYFLKINSGKESKTIKVYRS